MTFAKWTFRLAGLYGLLVLLPLYFCEEKIGRDFPPAITHPEHLYGFLGVAVAWQFAFLVLAQDPVRYRGLMLVAVLEKAGYGIAAVVLFNLGRVSWLVLGFGAADLLLGVLFLTAFIRIGAHGVTDAPGLETSTRSRPDCEPNRSE